MVKEVNHRFPGSAHVLALGLAEASDNKVWNYAKEYEFCIVTKDTDFDHLSFLYGPPPQCLRLNIGNLSIDEIAEILRKSFQNIIDFEKSSDALLVIQSL